MRYTRALAPFLFSAAVLIGPAAAQSQPETAPPPQQKQEGSQPAPSAQPEQQRGAEEAIKSESGKAGKQEPSAGSSNAAKEQPNDPVLVNGNWNVPGAPADSQTVPAKFSARNAALDKLPTLAWPIGLNDAQRAKILASVRASNAPVAKLDAKITEELPRTLELHELSPAVRSEMPNLSDIKFVRLENRVLLVYAPNAIVVAEIKYSN